MIEPIKLANCRAAFYKLTHDCVSYATPKFSSPQPRWPSHLFSRCQKPSFWKQFDTVVMKNSKNPLLDLTKYYSRGSRAWERPCYQLTVDTLTFLSRQLNDFLGQGRIATAIIE